MTSLKEHVTIPLPEPPWIMTNIDMGALIRSQSYNYVLGRWVGSCTLSLGLPHEMEPRMWTFDLPHAVSRFPEAKLFYVEPLLKYICKSKPIAQRQEQRTYPTSGSFELRLSEIERMLEDMMEGPPR